jgi:hypothetical protein
MPCDGDEIVIGELVAADHQFGADDSILAAQIVGDEVVAVIGKKCSSK